MSPDAPVTLEERPTDHRVFGEIILAALASAASVVLIFPFFASHGAEVNVFTTAILAGQALVFGLWTRAAWIYARAKGYERIGRLLPLWTILVFGFVAYLLRARPMTTVMRGRTIYSIECADAFLILGLAGVAMTITFAFLPHRRGRARATRTDDGKAARGIGR